MLSHQAISIGASYNEVLNQRNEIAFRDFLKVHWSKLQEASFPLQLQTIPLVPAHIVPERGDLPAWRTKKLQLEVWGSIGNKTVWDQL
jgi:hypothetical protein